MLSEFIPVAEQKLGYSFANPVRADENSLCIVVPILRETSFKRQYITFPETDQCPVTDTGAIDAMEADNKTEENVFFRSGTIFTGSTQARALQRSTLVFYKSKRKLQVRCVHRSHGISSGAKTTYGGLTPHEFDQGVYDEGFKPKGQHEYWESASNTTKMYMSSMGGADEAIIGSNTLHVRRGPEPVRPRPHGPQSSLGNSRRGYSSPAYGADDLANHMGNFAANFDSVLSKVKLVENQAGLALITQKGVETIELFDHKDSWKALHESAVKRLGANIVQKDDETVFDYKPEVARRNICRVLALDWKVNLIYEHTPDNGEPHVKISGLSAENYVGELFEINGSMIHALVLKKAA